MTKSERTRKYIIEKTAPVFNKQGFSGTSLTALEEATGLSKGSLYGNFSDKEEMAMEVFRYSVAYTKAEFAKIITTKNTAKEKLIAFFACFATYVFDPPIPGGCPIQNNAIEADDNNPAMKKAVAAEIESIISYIARLLDEGKKQQEFKSDIKSRELAFIFFTSIEGAIMVSRATASDTSMKAVIRHNKEILEQISL